MFACLRRFCRSNASRLASTAEHLLHCDGIWLHAYQYSGNKWSFKTELPSWAQPFFGSEGLTEDH